MAINQPNRWSSETEYATDERGLYWLRLRGVEYADDITGTQYIELQKHIRSIVADCTDQLKEHDITVVNVATQQAIDHRKWSNVAHIAIAFKTKGELMLAKLILKCEELG